MFNFCNIKAQRICHQAIVFANESVQNLKLVLLASNRMSNVLGQMISIVSQWRVDSQQTYQNHPKFVECGMQHA